MWSTSLRATGRQVLACLAHDAIKPGTTRSSETANVLPIHSLLGGPATETGPLGGTRGVYCDSADAYALCPLDLL